MLYAIAKFVHITGVVMLLGNITATAIWKFFADRTGNAVVIGFAQRLVTITDWSLTFWGVILTIAGGYGAAYLAGWDLIEDRWLFISQLMFVASGAMWVGMLVPLQIRMARAAKGFASGGAITEGYRRDSRAWLVWGLLATVPLVVATWLMIAKPA